MKVCVVRKVTPKSYYTNNPEFVNRKNCQKSVVIYCY